uniref:Toll-like receptor 22 n=2 Tax=Seriola dumerili TaxID=41447 RepID=A0A3B4T8Z9_SERDU
VAAMGSWSPFLFVFSLSVLLHFNPSLAYSLKNCTVAYSYSVTEVRVQCIHRYLTAVPDEIPQNATSLDLSSNQILKINRTDLIGLSKLKYLNLNKNSISHIKDGAFSDLVQLTNLTIDLNNLTNVTDNMFQGLSKLVYLSLYFNQITHISPLAFQHLTSLQRLILRFNNLHQIIAIVPVLQLPNFYELDLAQNNFISFQSDDLPVNISNLRTLKLNSNCLRKFSLTRDLFPHLESIHFSGCSSDFEWNVPNKTFLRSLSTLYLSETYISFETYTLMLQSADSVEYLSLGFMKQWLDEGLIDIACRLPALTRLKLTYNFPGSINDTLLQSCSKLTELNLAANDLTELSRFSLRAMKRLKRLDLHKNYLTSVPLAIRSLSTLQILQLSHNFIAELRCSDFHNLTRLTELNLSYNRISILKRCVFQEMNYLKVLKAKHNLISEFDGTFKFTLQNLQVLNLYSNNFNKLSDGHFQNLSSLRSLALESKIYSVAQAGAFEGLYDLQNLSVSLLSYTEGLFTGLQLLESLTLHQSFELDSGISKKKFEPSFSSLPSLKRLKIKNYNTYSCEISQNLLRGLKSLEHFAAERFFIESPHPDTFTYSPHLKNLQITQSNLSELKPELFQPIPNLQALDLSKNKLRSLDFLAQADLPALSGLTLRGNELTVINETIFQSLPALTYLDLFGNPFTCDCSNTGFIQWVKSNNQTQVINAYQFDCSFPLSKLGTKLLDFDIQSCWMDYSFLCFITSTCLVILTLLSSFIYHFLRWQLAYAFHFFLAFFYDSRKRRKGTPHRYDAFISYNIHNEDWVYREMLPVLEGEQGWRLCLHHRDFQPGKPIIENITDAIYSSRKTICVISRHYLQSEWCSREIQMASFRLFDEQKDVLILLFLEEIAAWQLSPYYRMRKLVKRRTYLSWPQASQYTGVFWHNVQRALETGDAPTETTDPLTGLAGLDI